MGLGGNATGDKDKETKTFTWSQIKEEKNKWLVINDSVYDVANFYKKHPGGVRIMLNHVGEDASDAFTAFHPNMKQVNKYMNVYKIGELSKIDNEKPLCEEELRGGAIMDDFRALRKQAEEMGCFKASLTFYFLHLAQILALLALARFVMGLIPGWYGYFIGVAILVISQAQAGWLQHDFGHLSVFKSNKLNHFMHHVVISTIKGVSSDWWNFGHFQHHAKPNIVGKDPDIALGSYFVLGKVLPVEKGLKKKGKWHQFQQDYFSLLVPPLLSPIYFNYSNVHFMYKKKLWTEFAWVASFFVSWCLIFGSIVGIFGTFKLYFLVRLIESYWFVWVTQMSHIPMHIDREKNLDWVRMQLNSTCNIEQSAFNDWFSGHLNFQIEHHLFPTMPRHNCHKIAPLVRSLCAKYNITYYEKPLVTAITDVYGALKESGELWYDAYNQ